MKKIFTTWAMASIGLVCASMVSAQEPAQTKVSNKATNPSLLHPWQASYVGGDAQAYFTNLKSGDVIETPYVLKFGLSASWGLAPITVPSGAKSGHHHLLINRDLPLDFKKSLPFNDEYIHFGKGQMETVLNLAPGTYTLRMLLADDKHLPHFVYNKPVTITVKAKNAQVDPKTLLRKGIALMLDSETAKTPFRVGFHASALNVAHLAQREKDTGHFRLTVIPKNGGKVAEMDFTQGQTETWLKPPAGDYTLKLEFLDNMNPTKLLADAVTASVQVQ